MKIGIVCRIDKTENNNVYVFNKELCDYLLEKKIKIFPIIAYDEKMIEMCDGFILPGGDNKTIDFSIIKYTFENDIPLLGICAGMQSIGEYFGGILENVENHYSKNKYVHEIKIDKNSKLFSILKIDKALVNSRHKYKLINQNIKTSAYSLDKTVECIECSDKKFFIGVSWHPESMVEYDTLSQRLFEYFIETCERK